MTAPLELSWAKRGDFIETRDVVGRSEPQIVFSNCGTIERAYHCVPCCQALVNIGNALLHCERPGEHRLVTFCARHRVYEQAEQTQIDAFASAAGSSW